MNKVLTILGLLLVISCSSTKTVESTAPQYSEETNRTFQEIERQQILEYYRQLREREARGEHRTPPPPTPQAIQRYQTQRPPRRPAPAPARPAHVRSSAIPTNPEDQAREIEQNLTFYCMRHRNATRFREEGSCESFTTEVENKCRQQFAEDDRRLFNCVRQQLQ
jgi:hypothetical protein